jgi:hypothetical protein
MKVPKFVGVQAGATPVSTVALDLESSSQALELARRFSERTGRTITVRDADGEILGTFGGRRQAALSLKRPPPLTGCPDLRQLPRAL